MNSFVPRVYRWGVAGRGFLNTLSVLAVLSLVAGCGQSEEQTSQADPIQVYAAASLQGAFTEIAQAFEEEQSGTSSSAITRVEFNFAGSAGLVTQMAAGGPADVFAAANQDTMDQAIEQGLVDANPPVFATNVLTIAVPTGNPHGITGLADLTDVTVAMCAPEVPCGAGARALIDEAGLDVQPASEESNVSDVVTKVSTGQVDAGLVYTTDVRANSGLEEVPIAGAAEHRQEYPIAITQYAHTQSRQGQAQSFVDFVLSESGQQILEDHGFGSAQ